MEGWKEEGPKKKPRKIRQMSPPKHTASDHSDIKSWEAPIVHQVGQ